MRIIKIAALPNGAHANQITSENITPPDGWAAVTGNIETPNFPFGTVTTDLIDGIPTVTSWTAGVMPPPVEPAQDEPSIEDDIIAQTLQNTAELAIIKATLGLGGEI